MSNARRYAVLLLPVLTMMGCVRAQAFPKVVGPDPFSFGAAPPVSPLWCLAVADKLSQTESAGAALTYAAGGGAVLAGFLALFLESKAATATSSLVSAGAAGGALYARHRAEGLDEMLSTYGCPRTVPATTPGSTRPPAEEPPAE